MGLLAIIAIFLTPTIANIQAQTQQPQQQAITPTTYAYDIQKQPKQMGLRFINDPTAKTVAPVEGFKLGPGNIVNLALNGDFVAAVSPQDPNIRILKVTLTDTNGQNVKELKQRSPESANYWLLTQITPGNHFCNTLVQFPDGRQGVFQAVCQITASGQAAQTLTPAQLTTINKNVNNKEITNNVATSIVKTKVVTVPVKAPPPPKDPVKPSTPPAPPAGGATPADPNAFPKGTIVHKLNNGALVVIQPGQPAQLLPPIVVGPDGPRQPFTAKTNPDGTISITSPLGTPVKPIQQALPTTPEGVVPELKIPAQCFGGFTGTPPNCTPANQPPPEDPCIQNPQLPQCGPPPQPPTGTAGPICDEEGQPPGCTPAEQPPTAPLPDICRTEPQRPECNLTRGPLTPPSTPDQSTDKLTLGPPPPPNVDPCIANPQFAQCQPGAPNPYLDCGKTPNHPRCFYQPEPPPPIPDPDIKGFCALYPWAQQCQIEKLCESFPWMLHCEPPTSPPEPDIVTMPGPPLCAAPARPVDGMCLRPGEFPPAPPLDPPVPPCDPKVQNCNPPPGTDPTLPPPDAPPVPRTPTAPQCIPGIDLECPDQPPPMPTPPPAIAQSAQEPLVPPICEDDDEYYDAEDEECKEIDTDEPRQDDDDENDNDDDNDGGDGSGGGGGSPPSDGGGGGSPPSDGGGGGSPPSDGGGSL